MNYSVERKPVEPVLFSLGNHPLTKPVRAKLDAEEGHISSRLFPDGETYLRVCSDVKNRHCILLEDLSHPNSKYLPLIFLADTLKDMGASSVGLVAPYLSYMRQDKRFEDGEAITSQIFARSLSKHVDWLITIDPHLHRYHTLDEIYTVPSHVVRGAPALAHWLKHKPDLLLIGPDAESRQWVSEIAQLSNHPFVIGEKERFGDRNVEVILPNLDAYKAKTAIIIDDVISSGHTILQCINALKQQNMLNISCAAIHGIFADNSDTTLLKAGLCDLVTSNTIEHSSNGIDVTHLLIQPIQDCIQKLAS